MDFAGSDTSHRPTAGRVTSAKIVIAGGFGVGKTSLGGMDVREDGRFVYVMNLGDRRLLMLLIKNPAGANEALRTIVEGAAPESEISCQELFGPITPISSPRSLIAFQIQL